MSKILEKLPKIRGKYRFDAPLKNWFNVGGNAEILFKPKDEADLAFFLQNRPKDLKITILGAASNVIISDSGVKGVVIRLGADFAQMKAEKTTITAGSATLCGNLALFSQQNSLAGLEFLSGIPGSIGGAVAMNAGCYGDDVAQNLISVKALDYQGKTHIFSAKDCDFAYRHNKIAPNYIFTEAKFALKPGKSQEIAAKIQQLCQNREKTQPIRAKTGGSTFKNPSPNDPAQKKAWQLIDEIGFRGKKQGDAEISQKHCNFMINKGKASASDLITLAKSAKNAVKSQKNIDLEMEIKILD